MFKKTWPIATTSTYLIVHAAERADGSHGSLVLQLSRHSIETNGKLNIEATLSYQKQLRIFISEHKWKRREPTEEALIIMGYGDDSNVLVSAIFVFKFVLDMPVVANRNTYQGLKLVNGSNYKALDIITSPASAPLLVSFSRQNRQRTSNSLACRPEPSSIPH
jgi:hypothetical protein